MPDTVTREDIAAAFRAAMIGHFRSHIPGTNINESTLIASDYLDHFQDLVTMLESAPKKRNGLAGDLSAWRPPTYEEHFSEPVEKSLAVAAYHRAPPEIRARFDAAVARLHGEAITLIGEVSAALKARDHGKLKTACQGAGARLRMLIEDANAIATGKAGRRA